jgi:hypothetical protein
MVEGVTRPLDDFRHPTRVRPEAPLDQARDLFVWFEDSSSRDEEGYAGIAGLPESLLPTASGMRAIERHYAPGHPHLLSAVRLRCATPSDERIAAIYTAALSVGTVAWIGSGAQYELAWTALYASGEEGQR